MRIRPSWDTFCTGPLYQPFVDAIGQMRSDWDATKPQDWAYWVDVHKNFCPHGRTYFLAWHRGFLYRFEEMLREVSGVNEMVLPYWDYYTHPQVPPQFLDTSSPLWRKQRTGDDVSGALSMDPFADTVTNFQRGTSNAFETLLETAPHNPVHNLIGGAMGDVAISPRDPLFWVHHANIDRLWLAWFDAGGGRHMPKAYKPYWQGDFEYGAAVATVPRVWARNPQRYMLYDYENDTMPSTLPSDPPPSTSTATAAAFSLSPARIGAVPMRPASVQTTPAGSAQPLALDEHSVTVDVPLSSTQTNQVRSLLIKPAASEATSAPTPLRLVLDGVQLTKLGLKGGYLYKIYLNLPDTAGVQKPERAYLLGMLGPFEITVAQMKVAMQGKGMQAMQDMQAQGAKGRPDTRFEFPLTDALRNNWPDQLDTLSISFVRVNGRRHPAKGDAIHLKSVGVEVDN
ncbi:MAG TPA: tyrosinase family protein [Frateuria sp.]|uniref:tyrosinase family protein n=1 Tax=Frateuria sp. TaxID=2211372 RepID=UPI002D7E3977|nr:tyrosinase family protein [Frateuria sp.]HET6806888.1 tyrosinase family protein [Frateuria sp.]